MKTLLNIIAEWAEPEYRETAVAEDSVWDTVLWGFRNLGVRA